MKYIWVLILLFSQIAWSAEDNLKGDAVQFSDLRVGPNQFSDLRVEELPLIQYYLHYCHSRGSALTEVITSLMGDPFQACKSVGLEYGEGFAEIDLKPFLQEDYYLHYCHSRGSALTEVITSLIGDQFQACKSVGLEYGEGFAEIDLKPFLQAISPHKPQTTNLLQNGQPINEYKYINPTMESSRPKIGGKAFLDIVCKDHENPEKCASELINGKSEKL